MATAGSTLKSAYENVERHDRRRTENVVLRARFHPMYEPEFDIAEEIRAIRLRDAEADLQAMLN